MPRESPVLEAVFDGNKVNNSKFFQKKAHFSNGKVLFLWDIAQLSASEAIKIVKFFEKVRIVLLPKLLRYSMVISFKHLSFFVYFFPRSYFLFFLFLFLFRKFVFQSQSKEGKILGNRFFLIHLRMKLREMTKLLRMRMRMRGG